MTSYNCSAPNGALTRATPCQNSSSASRAPFRPPVVSPWAITAAFIAPALVALTPSTSMHGSSRSQSRTPQVNAPWAPPPWRARLTHFTSGIAGPNFREIDIGRGFPGYESIATLMRSPAFCTVAIRKRTLSDDHDQSDERSIPRASPLVPESVIWKLSAYAGFGALRFAITKTCSNHRQFTAL